MIKYLFFDLDGTLTDSAEGIVKSVEYSLDEMGYVGERGNLRRFIGPPLRLTYKEFYESEADVEECVRLYRVRYSKVGWSENKLYDGVHEMLKALKEAGYKLFIATAKPEEFTMNIVKLFDIEKYFDGIAGATISAKRDTKADVVRYALSLAGEPNPSEVLMIGDRHHDVDGAGECGIKTLGVLYGFGDKEELDSAGAIATVESTSAVVSWVKANS